MFIEQPRESQEGAKISELEAAMDALYEDRREEAMDIVNVAVEDLRKKHPAADFYKCKLFHVLNGSTYADLTSPELDLPDGSIEEKIRSITQEVKV